MTGSYANMTGSLIIDSENKIMPYGPVLTGWDTIGNGTRMLLDVLHPLSDALPVVMELDIPPVSASGASEVGFLNYGKVQSVSQGFANVPRLVGNGCQPSDLFHIFLRTGKCSSK